ncbi:MAG: hypothetical protein H6706_01920 [Myxococcales bacterium]|nr:hypothetical protein [Myxococcales bacterium]
MSRPLACLLLAALAACEDAVPAEGPADARPADLGLRADAAAPDAALARLLHVGPSDDPRPPDGSQARPWPTPDAAAAVARPGDVIFLLPGRHPALTALPPGVELLGAGPEATTLAGPLTLDADGARAGGLRLVDGVLAVLAPAALHGLEVVGEAQPAETHLEIRAEAELVDVTVRDVAPGEAGAVIVETPAPVAWTGGGVADVAGIGLRTLGADLRLARLDLVRTTGMGALVDAGSARLDDVRLRGAAGAGLRFLEAEVALQGVVLEDVAYDDTQNTGSGVGFIGGTATVRDVTIARVERGLRATLGAQVTGGGVRVREAQNDGVTVHQAARVQLVDVAVEGAGNAGLTVSGAAADVEGLEVRAARRAGVFVADGEVDLRRVHVADGGDRGITALRSTVHLAEITVTGAAVGVQITEPVLAEVAGAQLDACADAGLAVIGPGRVALADVAIQALTGGVEALPAGLQIFDAEIAGHDVLVAGGVGEGLHLDGATGALAGVRVEGHGPGVVAFEGTVALEDVTVTGAAGAGVLASAGALTLRGATIGGTTDAPAIGPGDGVAALDAEVTLIDVASAGNAGSGLALLGGSRGQLAGRVDLSDNGAYGLQLDCASRVEGDFQAARNGRGVQGGCP